MTNTATSMVVGGVLEPLVTPWPITEKTACLWKEAGPKTAYLGDHKRPYNVPRFEELVTELESQKRRGLIYSKPTWGRPPPREKGEPWP